MNTTQKSSNTINCPLFINHIKNVLCSGNEAARLLKTLAEWACNPEQRLGVSIVLAGPQGCGKTLFTEVMKNIWGKNVVCITTNIDSTPFDDDRHCLVLHARPLVQSKAYFKALFTEISTGGAEAFKNYLLAYPDTDG